MPNTLPFTGPTLDDDPLPFSEGPVPQPPGPRPVLARQNPAAAAQQRAPVPRLAAPASPGIQPLRPTQRACYDALSLAMREGYVFAALTGPAGSGKSTVLDAVIADLRDRFLRWIRITEPDKVPARLATQIEQIAYSEASKPENGARHVVIAVDDAHTSSDELLRCLTRIASMREPGRRVPQMLLAGRPELWSRLGVEEFEPLARRLVVRATLPALEEAEDDPWASVEQELTQTMTHLRGDGDAVQAVPLPPAPEAEPMPPAAAGPVPAAAFTRMPPRPHAVPPQPQPQPLPPLDEDDDEIPPPSMYALFPDAPAKPVAAQPSARDRRSRILLPLGCLFVTVAAAAFVLSFYDWPDLLGDMPWADNKPAAPIVIPPSQRAAASNLPALPTWTGTGSPAPARRADAGAPPTSPVPARPAAPPAVAANNPPRAAEHPPVVATGLPPIKPAEPAAPSVAAAAPPPPPAPEPAPVHVAQASAPPVAPPQPSVSPPVAAPAAPPSPPPAPVVQVAPPSPPAPAPAPIRMADARDIRPATAALSPPIIALLLRRGDEEFAIGDVSAARSFYQRAAEAGSAQAAKLEARTFDGAFLPAADVSTLGDPDSARIWYERAAALGDAEAANRLKTLFGGQ